jgi:hypothetical protein
MRRPVRYSAMPLAGCRCIRSAKKLEEWPEPDRLAVRWLKRWRRSASTTPLIRITAWAGNQRAIAGPAGWAADNGSGSEWGCEPQEDVRTACQWVLVSYDPIRAPAPDWFQ